VNKYTFENETEQPVAKQGIVSLPTLTLNPVEVKLLLFFFPQKINLSSPKYLSNVTPHDVQTKL